MQWDELPSTEKEKKILQVLANECDKNPDTRFVWVDERDLGAKVGAYLDFVIYETDKLDTKGLVRRRNTKHGNKVMITEEGYRLVRTSHSKALDTIKSHIRYIVIGIIITVVAGLILAMIVGGWRPW